MSGRVSPDKSLERTRVRYSAKLLIRGFMKQHLVVMIAVASVSGAAAPAGSPNVSPLVGSWSVDIARLPIPPEARPKSVTITFNDPGDGKWATQVEVVGADGSKSHAEGIATLDGTAAPVKGNFEADVAAVKLPAPNVLVMMLSRAGVPASTRIYTVAVDGESMVETAAYFEKDGSPVMRTNYFTRMR
jgi:hypothetical protein